MTPDMLQLYVALQVDNLRMVRAWLDELTPAQLLELQAQALNLVDAIRELEKRRQQGRAH